MSTFSFSLAILKTYKASSPTLQGNSEKLKIIYLFLPHQKTVFEGKSASPNLETSESRVTYEIYLPRTEPTRAPK